jgi:hypothetical protein
MKPAFESYEEHRDIRLMCMSTIGDFKTIAHEADKALSNGCGILNFPTKSQIWEYHIKRLPLSATRSGGCGILNFPTKSQIWGKLVGG